MHINRDIKQKIASHAEKEYPYEACGILVGRMNEAGEPEILDYVSSDNADALSLRTRHFAMDPIKLYEFEKSCEKKGLEMIGFVHSHPDAPSFLSEEDKRNMIPELLYMIVGVNTGTCKDISLWKKDKEYMKEHKI